MATPQELLKRLENGIELSKKRGKAGTADLLAKKLLRVHLELGNFSDFKSACSTYSIWAGDMMNISGAVASEKVAAGDLVFAERMVHEGVLFEGNLLRLYLENGHYAEFKEIVSEGKFSINESAAANIAYWYLVDLAQCGDDVKMSQLELVGIASGWMVEAAQKTAEAAQEKSDEKAKVEQGRNWAAGILKAIKGSFE
ncbi:Uncharacterised protein [uncultured archaeon]|nr:Uncharacterised protein [uncultured archaeon]